MKKEIIKCTDNEKGKYIYDYCLGLLDKNEEEIFELHLYECEFCRNKLKEVATLSSIIKKLKERKNPLMSKFQKLMAIAASLLFLLPGILFIQKLNFPPISNTLTNNIVRGDNSDYLKLMENGLSEFYSGNFKSAEKHFLKLLKDNPNNFEVNFYLGLSLFNENNKKGFNFLKKAETIAQNIFKKTGNYRYLAKTYYYLGKNYMKFNEKAVAQKYFKKYLSFNDPFLTHNAEIKTLLKRLENSPR